MKIKPDASDNSDAKMAFDIPSEWDTDKLVSRRDICATASISYSTFQRYEKAGILRAAYVKGRMRRYGLRENLARLRAISAAK